MYLTKDLLRRVQWYKNNKEKEKKKRKEKEDYAHDTNNNHNKWYSFVLWCYNHLLKWWEYKVLQKQKGQVTYSVSKEKSRTEVALLLTLWYVHTKQKRRAAFNPPFHTVQWIMFFKTKQKQKRNSNRSKQPGLMYIILHSEKKKKVNMKLNWQHQKRSR